MTLDELLEYIGTEYLDDRSELLKGDPDDLWSDSVITRYLNEAQRILCRRAWVLIDTANVDAGYITLEQDEKYYDLHKSVIRVIKATPEDSDVPLFRTTEAELDRRRPVDNEYFDINAPETVTSGYPEAIATDAGTRQVRIYPPPSVDEEGLRLVLKIVRFPINWLDINAKGGREQEPEVAEEWHMALAKYAAGRCLTHPNADPTLKADGRALVREFEAEVNMARQERQRAEAAPVAFAHASTTAGIR